jgi:excisionase family DNA binding protein
MRNAAPLLSVQDCAAHWQVSPQTVRKWIAAGLLRVERLGARVWRITPAEVRRFERTQHPNEM